MLAERAPSTGEFSPRFTSSALCTSGLTDEEIGRVERSLTRLAV